GDDHGDSAQRVVAGAGRAVRGDEGSAGGGVRRGRARSRRGARVGGEVSGGELRDAGGAAGRDLVCRRGMDGVTDAATRAAEAARTSYGRLLALLAARCGDVTMAEDALCDAFERAVRIWPVDGVPADPDAWLLTVARN